MAFFVTWHEWLKLREDNARKRAVRAALNGTGRKLPGSYAACPSTNPRAMDSAEKTGFVQKQPNKLKIIETEQKPDYSIDRWLKMAQDLGNDVNKLVGHGEEEEKKLDKQKLDKEKTSKEKVAKKQPDKNKKTKPEDATPSRDSEEPDSDETGGEDDERKANTWQKLKQIHLDRLKNFQKDSSSSAESSKQQSKRP